MTDLYSCPCCPPGESSTAIFPCPLFGTAVAAELGVELLRDSLRDDDRTLRECIAKIFLADERLRVELPRRLLVRDEGLYLMLLDYCGRSGMRVEKNILLAANPSWRILKKSLLWRASEQSLLMCHLDELTKEYKKMMLLFEGYHDKAGLIMEVTALLDARLKNLRSDRHFSWVTSPRIFLALCPRLLSIYAGDWYASALSHVYAILTSSTGSKNPSELSPQSRGVADALICRLLDRREAEGAHQRIPLIYWQLCNTEPNADPEAMLPKLVCAALNAIDWRSPDAAVELGRAVNGIARLETVSFRALENGLERYVLHHSRRSAVVKVFRASSPLCRKAVCAAELKRKNRFKSRVAS